MRTTLDINEDLLKEVAKLSGAASKTDAVHTALEEYIRNWKHQKLLELRGKLDLEENWQELREAELREYGFN